MPTKPIAELLDRDLSKVQAREASREVDSLLRELVNHGTWVLRRCMVEAGRKRDVDLPAFVLYRHVLELTDGIQELLHECCVRASVPLVRAAFEACLSLEYLVQHEDTYERRARAWLVARLHRERVRERRHDPESETGTELRAAWTREFEEQIAVPEAALRESRQRRQAIGKLLSGDDFSDVWQQYQELQRSPSHVPHWYAVGDGPSNLRDLADELGHLVEYELWYRRWSSAVHATELMRQVRQAAPGLARLRPLRDGEGFGDIANYAATYALRSTRLLIGFFRPGENLESWYLREVQQRYHSLWPRPSGDEARR